MNDLTCRRFSDLLDEYLRGTLTGELSEAMRSHAEGCPDCGAVLAIKEDLAVEVTVPPQVVSRLEAGVAARIATGRSTRLPGILGRILVPALACACALLLFATGYFAGEVRTLRQEARGLREAVERRQGIAVPRAAGSSISEDADDAGRRRGAPTVGELILLLERLPEGARVLSPSEAGRLAGERAFLRRSIDPAAEGIFDDGLTAGEALRILRSLGLDPDARIELDRITDHAVPPAMLLPRRAAGSAS